MKMKNKLLYLLTLMILIALVAGGLKLRQQRQQELAQAAPPSVAPWAVHIATVTHGQATRGFPALALVKGANEVDIAPRLGGIILEMGPREGERISAGVPLARIDTRELEDSLASLQAEHDGAVADAERKARDAQRGQDLLKSHTISQSQVDQELAAARSAKEQVHSLEKQISAARTRIDYARITAPFDGVVAARLADPGDLAAVGKAIYRLIDTRSARLDVRLPAEVLAQVRPGTEVVLSRGDRILSLKADRVFPSLDERSLGRLEIDVPELPFDAVPGNLLRARVITDAVADALLVPADSLLPSRDPQHSRVLRLSDEQAPRIQIVPVTIRLRTAKGIAVEGELAAGDRLVVAHETTLLRLRDGDSVRVEGTEQ